MRLTPALFSPTQHDWLRSLTAQHLRRISHAIGTKLSGTKPDIIRRINLGLDACQYKRAGLPDANDPNAPVTPREMRILSIDMGVHNLAYANFIIPPDWRKTIDDPNRPRPILTAWKKIAVQDIIHLKNGTEPRRPSKSATKENRLTVSDEKEMPSVNPAVYAEYAYNLVSTLLDRHNPTHVLIERQRLRTGGGPNVFEWTLRVGMFESMIYSALYTLQRERGLNVFVDAVDPARVVSTVQEKQADALEDELKKQVASGGLNINSLNSKRLRVDLVGRWLGTWAEKAQLATASISPYDSNVELPDPSGKSGADPDFRPEDESDKYFKLVVDEKDEALRGFVLDYLEGWQRNLLRRRQDPNPANRIEKKYNLAVKMHRESDIRKLDDLADCLVQGLTWLDWHIMRDKILRGGVNALTWHNIAIPNTKNLRKKRK